METVPRQAKLLFLTPIVLMCCNFVALPEREGSMQMLHRNLTCIGGTRTIAPAEASPKTYSSGAAAGGSGARRSRSQNSSANVASSTTATIVVATQPGQPARSQANPGKIAPNAPPR